MSGDFFKWASGLNSRGLNVPTIRDPKTGKGSVSFTMVCVSFGLMAACAVLAILMVLSKWSKIFVTTDGSINTLKEAFSMAFQMAGLSTGLYWGRKWQDKREEPKKVEPTTEKPDNPDA